MTKYLAYRKSDRAWLKAKTNTEASAISGVEWVTEKRAPIFAGCDLDVLQAILKLYCPFVEVVIIPDLRFGQTGEAIDLAEIVQYDLPDRVKYSDAEADWARRHLVADGSYRPNVGLHFGDRHRGTAYYHDLRGWQVAFGVGVWADDPIGAFFSNPDIAEKIREAMEIELATVAGGVA
jgi:hypothetical protein